MMEENTNTRYVSLTYRKLVGYLCIALILGIVIGSSISKNLMTPAKSLPHEKQTQLLAKANTKQEPINSMDFAISGISITQQDSKILKNELRQLSTMMAMAMTTMSVSSATPKQTTKKQPQKQPERKTHCKASITKKVSLFQKPNESSYKLSTLKKNTKVEVISRVKKAKPWIEVRIYGGNNEIGYVPEENVDDFSFSVDVLPDKDSKKTDKDSSKDSKKADKDSSKDSEETDKDSPKDSGKTEKGVFSDSCDDTIVISNQGVLDDSCSDDSKNTSVVSKKPKYTEDMSGKLLKKKKSHKEYKGVKLKYSEKYHITSNPLNKRMGVKNYKGHRETYYSQKVLPGGGLKIPGRHVAKDGTIRDKDGYICVSAHRNFMKRGAKVMTSLGPGKVYDTGCSYGTIDIYVNW